MIKPFALALVFAISTSLASATGIEAESPVWQKARLAEIITALMAANLCPDSTVTQEDKVLLSEAGKKIVAAQGLADKTVFEIFTKPVMDRSNADLLGFCEAELGKVEALVEFWRGR